MKAPGEIKAPERITGAASVKVPVPLIRTDIFVAARRLYLAVGRSIRPSACDPLRLL